jgi:NADH-quinone oxidoreductase subunit J
MVGPRTFGRYLFQRYWLSIEIISFLLLVALIGALYLGKAQPREGDKLREGK